MLSFWILKTYQPYGTEIRTPFWRKISREKLLTVMKKFFLSLSSDGDLHYDWSQFDDPFRLSLMYNKFSTAWKALWGSLTTSSLYCSTKTTLSGTCHVNLGSSETKDPGHVLVAFLKTISEIFQLHSWMRRYIDVEVDLWRISPTT